MKAKSPAIRVFLLGAVTLWVSLLIANTAPLAAPGNQTKSSDYDTRESDVAKSPRNFAFRLGVGSSLPFNDHYDLLRLAPAFGGDITASLGRGYGVRFTLGRLGLRADKGLPLVSPAPPPIDSSRVLVGRTYDLTAVRYFASLEYSTGRGRRSPGASFFTLFAGAGVVSHFVEHRATFLDTAGQISRVGADDVITKFAVTFGGNISVMVTRSIGVDLAAQTDLVFAKENYDCTDCVDVFRGLYAYDGILELRLGVIFLL